MNNNTTLSHNAAEAICREKVIQYFEREFIDVIQNRLGIVIHSHQTKELHKTILSACHKFNYTPEDYLQMLNECPENSPLLEHLITGVTVGETYFFRDKRQMELLKNTILPEIIQAKRASNNLSLRIWSAGCASGEEIFTIAILLAEMLTDLNAWTLHLLGTDINMSALKKALLGQYSEWSMRSISEELKQRYFIKENNQYQLSANIRDLVCFSYLNLNDKSFPSVFNATNAQDLILCRNVLIYFNMNSIAQFMHKLYGSLVEGGYILLGASDPINITETNLIFHYEQGIIFSRPFAGSLPAKKNLMPLKDINVITTPKILPDNKTTQDIHNQTQKFKITPSAPTIASLLNETKWQEAINVINAYSDKNITSAFFLSSKATAAANLGQLDEAVILCKESLALDPNNVHTYYTLAMAFVELNQTKAAEAAFRKSIYLDHQFIVGHFQLGLLLIRNQQPKEGLKYLKNALNIVKNKNAAEAVADFPGLNYGQLKDIFEHEIELHIASRGIDHANKDRKKQ